MFGYPTNPSPVKRGLKYFGCAVLTGLTAWGIDTLLNDIGVGSQAVRLLGDIPVAGFAFYGYLHGANKIEMATYDHDLEAARMYNDYLDVKAEQRENMNTRAAVVQPNPAIIRNGPRNPRPVVTRAELENL